MWTRMALVGLVGAGALMAAPVQAACSTLADGVIPYLEHNSTGLVTVRATPTTTAGFAPVEGAIAYDTTNDVIKTCDGTSWNSVSGGGGASDYIVSSGNEAKVIAMPGGTVSITTGSVAGTSYFDTTGRWVGPGVSITTANGISSTNGYFTGNVGIGTTAPSSSLHVSGTITLGTGLTINGGTNGNQVNIVNPNSQATYMKATGSDGRVSTLSFNSYRIGSHGGGLLSSYDGPSNNFEAFNGNMSTTYFILANDAVANTMSQRNSTNAQTYRIYNTYGSTANWERAAMSWNSNVFKIDAEAGGTGVSRSISIASNGASNVGIGTTTPSGTLSVSGTVAMSLYSAAPVACGATYKGLMALTSAAHMCVCDGSSWVDVDGRAACSW